MSMLTHQLRIGYERRCDRDRGLASELDSDLLLNAARPRPLDSHRDLPCTIWSQSLETDMLEGMGVGISCKTMAAQSQAMLTSHSLPK